MTPPPTPRNAAAYQRKRLWCGITGIGLILVSLWTAALLGAAGGVDRLVGELRLEIAGAVVAVGLGLVASLLQIGPDVVAAKLEVRVGQRTPEAFGRRYVQGLTEWLGGLAAAGALLGLCVRIFGDNWWIAAAVGLTSLAFGHVFVPFSPGPRAKVPDEAWWNAVADRLRTAGLPVPTVAWFDHGERSLAGGWNGVGRWQRLFLATSLRQVEPEIAATLIAREIGHLRLGHRVTTMLSTAAWIVAGVALARIFTPADVGVGGIVFVLAATMSTWCWLGLLGLWPTLGKRQIYQADAFSAKQMGLPAARAALAALAKHNLPDERLPTGVAFVFHPIPPMADRRAALENLS